MNANQITKKAVAKKAVAKKAPARKVVTKKAVAKKVVAKKTPAKKAFAAKVVYTPAVPAQVALHIEKNALLAFSKRATKKAVKKAEPVKYNWLPDLGRISMLLNQHPAVFTKPAEFESIEKYSKALSARVCMRFGGGQFSIKLSTCRDYLVVTTVKR
jgi:hypothetical protein